MKKAFFTIISILLISCGSTSSTKNNANTIPVETQEKNEATTVETETVTPTETVQNIKSNPDILIGIQQRTAFDQEPFNSWFNKNYENHPLDSITVTKITPFLKDVTIVAFMGTWCGDSKRETPKFYKILDTAEYDYKNLELITVSRNKDTPDKLEKGLDIKRVPTFIFYKNGKEIGRYVEYARESLEKDILTIVSGKPYKHSYEN